MFTLTSLRETTHTQKENHATDILKYTVYAWKLLRSSLSCGLLVFAPPACYYTRIAVNHELVVYH